MQHTSGLASYWDILLIVRYYFVCEMSVMKTEMFPIFVQICACCSTQSSIIADPSLGLN